MATVVEHPVNVSKDQNDERNGGEIPTLIAQPIGERASEGGNQIVPEALVACLGADRLGQETGCESREDQHGDPVIGGFHEG